MTLYYETDRVTLYLADAAHILGDIPTESVDLVITDPPYGVEWRSNRRADRFDELTNDGAADRAVVHNILAECVRVVGQRRHLYTFGPTDVLDGLKVSQTAALVWHKGRTGMGNLSAPWGPAHEEITFAVGLHGHSGERGKSFLPVRLRKGSVLTFPAPTGRNVRHPSEKPVALLRELVESSSRADEVVLDPFAGVGSTGVAAILSGRRTILVEVDERYAAIAADRLKVAERIANEADRA